MNEKGYKVDHFLERTRVAGMVGFFWLARAVKRQLERPRQALVTRRLGCAGSGESRNRIPLRVTAS